MAEVIPDKYKDLFNKKVFANLATIMPDGSPQVTPVWLDYDGENLLINTAAGRVKDKNLQRNRFRLQHHLLEARFPRGFSTATHL